jgi:hypothetical protein
VRCGRNGCCPGNGSFVDRRQIVAVLRVICSALYQIKRGLGMTARVGHRKAGDGIPHLRLFELPGKPRVRCDLCLVATPGKPEARQAGTEQEQNSRFRHLHLDGFGIDLAAMGDGQAVVCLSRQC